MSSLADRLRRVINTPAAPSVAALAVESGLSRTPPATLEEVLGGEWRGDGRSFVVERRVPAEHAHGRTRVGDLATELARAAGGAALLASGAPARSPFLFFDLETTGLGGGAGTYAFLVGFGWFADDGAFVTRQYVLVNHGIERSMLECVAADLAGAGALVSFNGKSFDAPVLETRFLFHRLEWTAARQLPHIDALHPARQFWGHSHGEASCSLISLEQHLLGVRRVGDVPGFEIPARYFEFVRTGDARPLTAVVEHNRLDLLSLAAVTARLLDLVVGGPRQAGDGREAIALGRLYARGGLDGRARDAFQQAVELAVSSPNRTSAAAIEIEGLRALAVLLRRARQYEDAAACWRRLLDLSACPRQVAREASEALAIHHEHRVRDLAAAKVFALRGLEEGMKDGAQLAWNDAVRHRLRRIERKMASGRPLFPSWPSPPSCGSLTSARRTSS